MEATALGLIRVTCAATPHCASYVTNSGAKEKAAERRKEGAASGSGERPTEADLKARSKLRDLVENGRRSTAAGRETARNLKIKTKCKDSGKG